MSEIWIFICPDDGQIRMSGFRKSVQVYNFLAVNTTYIDGWEDLPELLFFRNFPDQIEDKLRQVFEKDFHRSTDRPWLSDGQCPENMRNIRGGRSLMTSRKQFPILNLSAKQICTVNVRNPKVGFGKPNKKWFGFQHVMISDVGALTFCWNGSVFERSDFRRLGLNRTFG